MATIVNARDVLLQAAGVRLISLPVTGTIDYTNVTGATRPSDNADVTVTAVNGGIVVTGGGVTFNAGGSLKGGQTAYNTGTGFFAGYSGGAYKFSFGNPAGNRITWDGASLTISGNLDFADVTGSTRPANNADVTVAAFNAGIAPSSGGITLTGGGHIKGGQTDYATGSGFFLGYSSGYKFSIGSSSKYLRWDGSALSLKGDITGDSSIDITGTGNFGGATSVGGFGTTAISGNVSGGSQIGAVLYAGTTGAATGLIAQGGSYCAIQAYGAGTTETISVSNTNASGYALGVYNNSGGYGIVSTGKFSLTESNASGISMTVTHASGAGGGAAKFFNTVDSKEVWLAPGAYAAYSPSGGGKQYFVDGAGPFTGFHPALALRGTEFEIGDIVADSEIFEKPDISNTWGSARTTTVANERGVLGVVAEVKELTIEMSYENWWMYAPDYLLLDVNGIGEGQVNVCGEGGDIKKGDLIVASGRAGKGMRQADDIVRGYTVAKAREDITFLGDEIRQCACIYLAG